jgi:hypothetical protein
MINPYPLPDTSPNPGTSLGEFGASPDSGRDFGTGSTGGRSGKTARSQVGPRLPANPGPAQAEGSGYGDEGSTRNVYVVHSDGGGNVHIQLPQVGARVSVHQAESTRG